MKTGMSRAYEPIGKSLEYPYFSGGETRSISYIGVPRILLTDDKFKNVSAEAKLLYGIMVDRTKISARNGWVDKEGSNLMSLCQSCHNKIHSEMVDR